jgi:hypothetical protein
MLMWHDLSESWYSITLAYPTFFPKKTFWHLGLFEGLFREA